MNDNVKELWVYLSETPLLWLTLTLLAYQAGSWIFRRLGSPALLNPVLTAIVFLVILLKVSGTDYQTYFRGAQFIHFLLGPATVALAIPLYREVHAVKSAFIPIALTLLTGSLTGILSAVGISFFLGGGKEVLLTVAPKSVTTPIAIGISEQIGGIPSLTAVIVVLTGIAGSVIGDFVLAKLGIKDEMAYGMALGIASHGVGTAHAIQKGRVAGAFSALAMALNGLLTAIILPVITAFLR